MLIISTLKLSTVVYFDGVFLHFSMWHYFIITLLSSPGKIFFFFIIMCIVIYSNIANKDFRIHLLDLEVEMEKARPET